jgi:hypothetical protein
MNSHDTSRLGSANSGTASAQRTSVMRAKNTGRRITALRSFGVGGRPAASQARMRSKRGRARRHDVSPHSSA